MTKKEQLNPLQVAMLRICAGHDVVLPTGCGENELVAALELLKERGLIEKAGRCLRAKGHGSAGAHIWQLTQRKE